MTPLPLLFTTSALLGLATLAIGLIAPSAFAGAVGVWLLFALLAAGFVWLLKVWTGGGRDARNTALWLTATAAVLFLLPRWPHESVVALFGALDGDTETVLRNAFALAVAGLITAWVLVRGPALRLPGE